MIIYTVKIEKVKLKPLIVYYTYFKINLNVYDNCWKNSQLLDWTVQYQAQYLIASKSTFCTYPYFNYIVLHTVRY